MARYFDLAVGDAIDLDLGQAIITVVKKSGRAGKNKLRLKVEVSDPETPITRRQAERISACLNKTSRAHRFPQS